MMSSGDVENVRRSAAMAPLSKAETERVLKELDRLVKEREAIASVVANLPKSWVEVRSSMNELSRLLWPPL